MENKIPQATAATVLNSLKGGVVPRTGLEYITVGRRNEIQALLKDVAIIENGGAAIRFIEGNYGSGKTFLMHALRNHVMEKNFVVSDVELSVDKRFVGNKGQGLATYKELIKNMAISACPDKGALQVVLNKWISNVENYVVQVEGLTPGNEIFDIKVSQRIYEITSSMETKVNGFDFGRVLATYFKGKRTGREELQRNALRWLYGDYKTKTEAKTDLGVNMIIADDNWFDFIKLFADFVVMAGYTGFYIFIDELANIYEIPSRVGREYNYSKLLTIYNDALQGKTNHMGIILSVTKEGMEDPVRGVYSFEALRTRIEDKRETAQGIIPLRDLAAPVIHLSPLNPGEMYVLIEKLTQMHEIVYEYESRLEHDDYIYFLKTEYAKCQDAKNITVREMVRNYITLLNLTQQHQNKPKEEILCAQ